MEQIQTTLYIGINIDSTDMLTMLNDWSHKLLHITDQDSLPLTLTMTHVIMTKHQETLVNTSLGQLSVVRDQVLCIPDNTMKTTFSYLNNTRETRRPVPWELLTKVSKEMFSTFSSDCL